MIPHFSRYQKLAVDDYGFAFDASNLEHPRLSLNEDYGTLNFQTAR